MTNLTILVNKVDADLAYGVSGSGYVILDLLNDYLIWTAGSADVAAGQDEPTELELNEAATEIDPANPVTVAKCLVFDKDDGVGTLRLVQGMGEAKQYVFGFSFDGATASEPQLEAWDDSDHDSIDFHVLGNGVAADSMLKAVCTTIAPPDPGWVGAPLAGASNVLLLNNGSGALPVLPSGETSQELYANLKIVIPSNYSTPGVEPFTLTCRYTWN